MVFHYNWLKESDAHAFLENLKRISQSNETETPTQSQRAYNFSRLFSFPTEKIVFNYEQLEDLKTLVTEYFQEQEHSPEAKARYDDYVNEKMKRLLEHDVHLSPDKIEAIKEDLRLQPENSFDQRYLNILEEAYPTDHHDNPSSRGYR